jgi:hypothetical protein
MSPDDDFLTLIEDEEGAAEQLMEHLTNRGVI